jgi:putative ABC transport system substrate-binding protein
MKRRAFIAGLGSAAAWSVVARAQQSQKTRLVGVLMGFADSSDPDGQARLAAFRQALAALGWREGDNLRIEVRWGAGDVNRSTSAAKELVGTRPDVILSHATLATDAVHRATSSIPIVFVAVPDPIGSGFVESLPHPGGNMTGFLNFEATVAEKWLELLKEIAPRTARVGFMFNPRSAPYAEYHLKPLQNMAPKLGVTVFSMHVWSDGDIETALGKMANDPGCGLILAVDIFLFVHRQVIVDLTARYNIPMISAVKELPMEGALMSYGPNGVDLLVRSASYVDRILRSEKPSELPVQAPTKFELVVNLKTAKALALDVPSSLIARADEVIE